MLNLITFIQSWVTARTEDPERGATMVEYGLLVVFIAVVAGVGAAALGVQLDTLFDTVTADLVP